MSITPEFFMDLKTQIAQITAQEYQRLSQNQWWREVAIERPSMSAKERLVWWLDTASIRREDHGTVTFESLMQRSVEYQNKFASAGLKITKEDLEDLQGGIPGGLGMSQASEWARQIGAKIAYWPQQVVAEAMLDNIAGYDGVNLFATNHPVNPFIEGAGTFSNIINGSILNAAGLGSDAPSIHAFGSGSVTVDEAFDNLSRVYAYIATLKMPDGKTPRMLRPRGLLVVPGMSIRAQQVVNGRIIAQAARSGGGGADVEGLIKNQLGFQKVHEAYELSAAFSTPAGSAGSNTSYYVLMEQAGQEISAVTYVNREPFQVIAMTPNDDSILAVTREFQWTCAGRNVVGAGHPYQLFRVDAE
jgi:phage major head subunit gpT-like protein